MKFDDTNVDEILTDIANRLYEDKQISDAEYGVMLYVVEKLREDVNVK